MYHAEGIHSKQYSVPICSNQFAIILSGFFSLYIIIYCGNKVSRIRNQDGATGIILIDVWYSVPGINIYRLRGKNGLLTLLIGPMSRFGSVCLQSGLTAALLLIADKRHNHTESLTTAQKCHYRYE